MAFWPKMVKGAIGSAKRKLLLYVLAMRVGASLLCSRLENNPAPKSLSGSRLTKSLPAVENPKALNVRSQNLNPLNPKSLNLNPKSYMGESENRGP